MHSNNFSSKIPMGFANAMALQDLPLSNNQLTRFMLEGLSSLWMLVNFSVDFNLLHRPLLAMGKNASLTFKGNYLCSNNPVKACSREVNALLVFLQGVGCPPTMC